MKSVLRRSALAVSLGLIFSASPALADYELLPARGEEVVEECNPTNSPDVDECEVDSLPGQPGFELVAARSSPIIKNEVTIGTLFDTVWRKGANYIFGVRLLVNAEPFDATGLSFNVNDVFRRTLPDKPVSVAYFPGFIHPSEKALQQAGRTCQGLNEEEMPGDPERDNSWVEFRVDVNANDPDGMSSPTSPWLLTRTKAPDGFSVQPFAIRILNSDLDDPTDATDIFTAGYAPVGVPDTGCNAEEE